MCDFVAEVGRCIRACLVGCGVLATPLLGNGLLVEAESLSQAGGWQLDTQFIDVVGSPYLLAHGLGRPVPDAQGMVSFPAAGTYHVYVRTKDWVAPWKAPGAPGKFQLQVGGDVLPHTFGTQGAEWQWEYGGKVSVTQTARSIRLKDLTGFDGRCDAIYFSPRKMPPPESGEPLAAWRKVQLGLPPEPLVRDGYDLVVIGGGYSGLGSAISAARMGCKVALVQNRPVLGGNGSSEVRVWSMGYVRRGKYPRVGEMVEEFCDHATKSPGRYEEFEDAKKEALVRAEANIDLYLNHHVFAVDSAENEIRSVTAFDTRSSAEVRFLGKLFADCTGHGTIGFLAGADWEMTPKGRMGMSNMWAWAEGDQPVAFPETPWALPLTMKDFPYPRDHHGQWFWEGGFDKDPIREAELIRDWNFRAVYGAFNAMKNGAGAEKHKTAYLTWLAYIGGPRESRRLMGDIVLQQDDIVEKVDFPDGCVPSTWSIDLHYPKKQYAEKFPDNPFISIAVHDRRIDRSFGYPVPYRCFYSRNIGNLFMAGRCVSVTHEALGTTRVMRTCGMMGEVVGKAASLCVLHDCGPRDVYENHWSSMDDLLRLPGKARRPTVDAAITIPADALPLATAYGPIGRNAGTGVDPQQLPGLIVDDVQAKKTGNWTAGSGLAGFIGSHYLYAAQDATIEFGFSLPADGAFVVSIAYQPHENRGNQVPVTLQFGGQTKQRAVNMRERAPEEHGFYPLGEISGRRGQRGRVTLSTKDAGGYVHADAIQVRAISR